MTDQEEVPTTHAHKRNTHANRGRPFQNRIYHHLGVRDLREIIDRKRSERCEPVVPPPDPSYNYLKDPLRENSEDVQEHPPRPNVNKKYYNKNQSSNNFKRDREHHAGNVPNQSAHKDIENPLNITVEFSTSTGEHVYKMDESTVLPTIKHVPDRLPVQNRFFRGRGRGRGRGQRSYQTRTVRSRKHHPNENSASQNAQTDQAQQITVSVEENWDDDINKAKEGNEEGRDGKSEEIHDYEDAEDHLGDEEVACCKTEEDGLDEGLKNLKLDQPSTEQISHKLDENKEEKEQ